MKKKYFTEEEKKIARQLEAKKYYNKIKKIELTDEEKKKLKKEKEKKREIYLKEYYIKNKEKLLIYSKNYFKNNKEYKQKRNNERYKKRRLEDPVFKLSNNIKRSIRGLLRKKGLTKSNKTNEILGCSFIEFKQHLETQFKDWMNWDNYGLYNGGLDYGWDIDHIIPLAKALTEEDVIKLNHYTNLQPLCSYTNRTIKRNKL